jgi:hypothetical protein
VSSLYSFTPEQLRAGRQRYLDTYDDLHDRVSSELWLAAHASTDSQDRQTFQHARHEAFVASRAPQT